MALRCTTPRHWTVFNKLLLLTAISSLGFIYGNIVGYSLNIQYPNDRNDEVNSKPRKLSGNQVKMAMERHGSGECSKQLTLLTPTLRPFEEWREYELLKKAFEDSPGPQLDGSDVPVFKISCPQYTCNLTVGATIRDFEFLKNSDGVVINLAPNMLKTKLPYTVKRLTRVLPKDSTWFFLGMESPQMYMYWDPDIANITYHGTITYHSESRLSPGLSVPYGYFVTHHPMDDDPRQNWARGKSRLISWMASNCENTFWPRTDFVHELLKYIPIDMYGKCGNLTCLPPMSSECKSMLGKYKFYLALENVECDEYISEKFWDNCLQHGVVPVVYGGRRSAYEKVAPPNSFIHVGDFANPRELADYLLQLDKNDDLYNEYFQWRLRGHVKLNYPPFHPEIFCETIPLMISITRHAFNSKHSVAKSDYYNSCRGKPSGRFVRAGSLSSWTPWK